MRWEIPAWGDVLNLRIPRGAQGVRPSRSTRCARVPWGSRSTDPASVDGARTSRAGALRRRHESSVEACVG